MFTNTGFSLTKVEADRRMKHIRENVPSNDLPEEGARLKLQVWAKELSSLQEEMTQPDERSVSARVQLKKRSEALCSKIKDLRFLDPMRDGGATKAVVQTVEDERAALLAPAEAFKRLSGDRLQESGGDK